MADPFDPNKINPEETAKDEFGKLKRDLLRVHPDHHSKDAYGSEIHKEAEELTKKLSEKIAIIENRKISFVKKLARLENLKNLAQADIDAFFEKVRLKDEENAKNSKKKETFIPLAEFKTKFLAYTNNKPNFDSERSAFYANGDSYDPASGTVKIRVVFNGEFEEKVLGTVDEFDQLIQDAVVSKTKTLKEIFGFSGDDGKSDAGNREKEETKEELTKEQVKKIEYIQGQAREFQKDMEEFDWDGEGFDENDKKIMITDRTKVFLRRMILDHSRIFRGMDEKRAEEIVEKIIEEIKK